MLTEDVQVQFLNKENIKTIEKGTILTCKSIMMRNENFIATFEEHPLTGFTLDTLEKKTIEVHKLSPDDIKDWPFYYRTNIPDAENS